MPLDWSVVVGAGVGAAIGLAGQAVALFGARKQEERTYARVRSEAERQEDRRRERERQDELRRREENAAFAVIRCFHDNAVGLLASPSEADNDRVLSIVLALHYRHFFFRDGELRRRLAEAKEILEFFGAFPPPGHTIPSVIWVVRLNVLRWLAAFLREESIPSPTTDWCQLADNLEVAFAEWRKQLELSKIKLRDFRFSIDSY
jgi:hypothetical protein